MRAHKYTQYLNNFTVSVYELTRMADKNQIVLVNNIEKDFKVTHSILTGLPVKPLYLVEDIEGILHVPVLRTEVQSIIEYAKSRALKAMPTADQAAYLDRKVTVWTIQSSTPMELGLEILTYG